MLMEGKLRRSKFRADEYRKEKNLLRSKISDLLYQLTYNEVYRELKPGEVFGGIHLLDKDQWEPSFVYPLEDSKVAFIAAPDVTGIISNMKRLKEA